MDRGDFDIKIIQRDDGTWAGSLTDSNTGRSTVAEGETEVEVFQRLSDFLKPISPSDPSVPKPETPPIEQDKTINIRRSDRTGRWQALYGESKESGIYGEGRNISEAIESWLVSWKRSVKYG